MKAVLDIILVILYLIGFYLFFTTIIFWQQRRVIKTQIKDFDIDASKYILIKVMSESIGTWRHSISSEGKANMYFKEDFLFISPRIEKGFLHFLKPSPLAFIFTKNLNKIQARTKIGNVYVPDYIQIGENYHIEIQYKYNPLVDVKDYFYIDVIDTNKYEELRKIKAWWDS